MFRILSAVVRKSWWWLEPRSIRWGNCSLHRDLANQSNLGVLVDSRCIDDSVVSVDRHRPGATVHSDHRSVRNDVGPIGDGDDARYPEVA